MSKTHSLLIHDVAFPSVSLLGLDLHKIILLVNGPAVASVFYEHVKM